MIHSFFICNHIDRTIRELPDMMSASEGGGGSWKSSCSWLGCDGLGGAVRAAGAAARPERRRGRRRLLPHDRGVPLQLVHAGQSKITLN